MVSNLEQNRKVNSRPEADEKSLVRRLQKVDFAITETVLYLDAYPESKEAMSYYKKLVAERDMLMARLSAMGKPTTHFDNSDATAWHWTKGPWPWQSEAN